MYGGPYLILRKVGPVNLAIQKTRRSKPIIVHVDKVKICKSKTPQNWLNEQEESEEKEDTVQVNQKTAISSGSDSEGSAYERVQRPKRERTKPMRFRE